MTGATGFIGSAVARLLDTRGLAVSVLARATSPRGNLKDLKCEVALGDMTDAAAMNRALNGVRYLFHVAADCRLWAPDRSEIVRTNREGTRVVMRAASAKKAGGWFFRPRRCPAARGDRHRLPANAEARFLQPYQGRSK